MTPEETQQILAALEGIKAAYNAAIPHFLDAQKVYGATLNPLVRQYNETTAAIQTSFDSIRGVSGKYAELRAPVINVFSVTATELSVDAETGCVERFQMLLRELPDEQAELTVTTPAGTATAVAKA
jgi:hypothetical protein